MNHRHGSIAAALAVGLLVAAGTHATELQPVESVIARLAVRDAGPVKGASPAVALMKDIEAFRGRSAQLAAPAAAAEWLALWDRTLAVTAKEAAASLEAYDAAIGAPVGARSMLASLPAPEAWPAIRVEGHRRAAKSPDDTSATGLKLLGELLTRDVAAARLSLTAFERRATSASPEDRESRLMLVSDAKALLYKLYGTREEIAAAFRASIDAQAKQRYRRAVFVPDLVGLLGATQAEALLTEALRQPVMLEVPEGQATKSLARRLALRDVARLRKPQWGLIDGVGTSTLYEAMHARFVPRTGPASAEPAQDDTSAEGFGRRAADVYYFLDLVIARRHAEAERVMLRATAGPGGELHLPRQAMAELARRGENAAIHGFLSELLARRPQAPSWDFYLEQAGSLGRTREAIALMDKTLKRTDLPPYLRDSLNDKRLDALLADDQVDAAAAGYIALLAGAPSRDDPKLERRVAAALRLAGLGRVMKRPDWSRAGLGYASRAVPLVPATPGGEGSDALPTLLKELRRHHLADQAQSLALAALEREDANPGFKGMGSIVADDAKRAALVELAGLYDAAGRTADVQRLLDEVGIWGASDLAELASEKDSMGTPFVLMAARALKARGNTPAAKAAALAVIARWPGHDPAYQLFVDIAGDSAADELEALARRDPFEERPLIWQATALLQARQLEQAEASARRAIAIDPSDGEQGVNDRMRAYAVLGDILEARNDARGAQGYRRAVAAIRQSEEADELHKLGLYQRAFAGYRAALAEFSDAYCIQSRLAVQLGKSGLHEEALKHYRRAFELMPESFGRVESHCFGCESVFAGPTAQAVAEEVFTRLVASNSSTPQAPYMLAYLRKEQGRHEDAVGLFRQAISLDALYLNAWRQLNELGAKTYIEPGERDIARLRLLELDPRQKHVRYELSEVADLTALWRALEPLEHERRTRTKAAPLYPLAASVRARRTALDTLPPDMRLQMEQYVNVQVSMTGAMQDPRASHSLGNHKLLLATLRMMGKAGGTDAD